MNRRPGGARRRLRRAAALLVVGFAAGCATAGPPPPETFPPGTLVGGCGAMPALAPRYRLPFPPGQSHELTQGNCGAESHTGRFRYAFDFRMPPGTPVIAARDGTVIVVRDDRPDGTGRTGDANLVMIEHPNGEISRYIHLRRNGVRVVAGDRVAAGDTIALSGNSGRSAFPHLHFDVATDCGRDGCRTVPSAFLNADPPIPTTRTTVTALEPDTDANAEIDR